MFTRAYHFHSCAQRANSDIFFQFGFLTRATDLAKKRGTDRRNVWQKNIVERKKFIGVDAREEER